MAARPLLRVAIAALALLAAASPGIAGRKVLHDPPNTDRPGGDYTHAAVTAGDPDACVRRCAADPQCAAYTYVRPGFQGPLAMCWLKRAATPARSSPCCESGQLRYVADRPIQNPAEVAPPETLNEKACTLGLTCANRVHGRWRKEVQTCDCWTQP